MEQMATLSEMVSKGKVTNPAELSRIEKLYEEILLETSPNRLAARVAAIYAESLLSVANARGNALEVGDELDSLVHSVFTRSPELEMFLANPAVHRKRKLAVIDKAIAGHCSPLLEDFLKLLCKHDRLAHLRLIAVSYQALRDRAAGQQRILVGSAVPMTDEQLDHLKVMLAKALNETPILINRVRPELLGGVQLHVGDKVYDMTVRYRLDALRTQFLARGSHEIQTRRDRFSSNV